MKHVDLTIIGRVQGVFFRYLAKVRADELGLTGVAWNAEDGSVRIEIEGEESDIEPFIRWCRRGPTMAQVEGVDAREGNIKGYTSFEIRPS